MDVQEPQSPLVGDEAPSPEPEPVDSAQEAEKVKEQGNLLFKAGKLLDAIERYGRAIGAYSSTAPGTRVP